MTNRRAFILKSGAMALASAGIYMFYPANTPGVFAPYPASAKQKPEIEDMALGSDTAPITVIEYASYTCSHCRRFHEEVFPLIKENYIDTGKVRFVLREVYFDRYGLWASIVARCDKKPARFFAITDQIFRQQSAWTEGAPVEVIAHLRRIGRATGLSKEELDHCLSDAPNAKALNDTSLANREADNITGTPQFLINSKPYKNIPYTDFKRIFDEQLDR